MVLRLGVGSENNFKLVVGNSRVDAVSKCRLKQSKEFHYE